MGAGAAGSRSTMPVVGRAERIVPPAGSSPRSGATGIRFDDGTGRGVIGEAGVAIRPMDGLSFSGRRLGVGGRATM